LILKIKNNTRGLSLVEVIVSIGIISLFSLIALTMMNYLGASLTRSRNQETLTYKKQKIINTLSNQISWDMTIANNTPMNCRKTYPSSCADNTSANIDLYDGNGNKILDSTGGISYRRDGSPCPSGSSVDECPLTISLGWKVTCSTVEECKYPVDLLKLTLYHDPTVPTKGFNPTAFNINWTSRRNLSKNSSPLITCIQYNKVFVGFGQSITDGAGTVHTADSNGCMSLNVFQGPKGFAGGLGPTGPKGDPGPPGVIFATPPPPTPPVPPPVPLTIAAWCATDAQTTAVCNSFQSKLGRKPDFTSAKYYLDLLNGGTSIAQIEHQMSTSLEALGQAAAGKYSYPSAVGDHGIELGFDIYTGGIAVAMIDGVSVSFILSPGKKMTPEEAYAAYTNAALAKGLDINKPEVIGDIEKSVISDIAAKINK
jgi:type II secretory pathway pseudopilin PulG